MTDASVSLRDGPRIALGLRLLGDDRLARLAAGGDKQAFAAIYERHHQALYRYCRSILHDGDDAQDALHNTMLKALRALPGERRTIALKPWLYRIAHHESISLLRRRRPAVDIAEAARLEAPAPAGSEGLEELMGDLRTLPARQRAALVMRELSDLDYAAIAAALDVAPTAAKQLVYEARRSLHARREGRELACDTVRRAISTRDGRRLRDRRLRAHLGDCGRCREFQAAIASRRGELAMLTPPLPATAAAAVLESILGGAGGAGGGGLVGLLAGAAAKGGGATAAFKTGVAGATAAITFGTGGAALGVVSLGGGDPAPNPGLSSGEAASLAVASLPSAAPRAEIRRVDDRSETADRVASERGGGRVAGGALAPPAPGTGSPAPAPEPDVGTPAGEDELLVSNPSEPAAPKGARGSRRGPRAGRGSKARHGKGKPRRKAASGRGRKRRCAELPLPPGQLALSLAAACRVASRPVILRDRGRKRK